MIYADNAATTKLDIDALEAMKPFLLESYGNASQPYSFSRSSKMALKTARETIASYIGAEPNEIYFTSGGTESDNWAIKMGAGKSGALITSAIEHHAVLQSCAALERAGRKIVYLPVTSEGLVLPESLRKECDNHVKLVSVMTANNEVGSIQEIKKLAAISHENGAIFHTDAVQAVGHIPLHVKELGVDMLSASAHKFNGPKGIGFLYIRKGVNIFPYMEGGGQESGYRAGTENIAAIIGMSVALKNNYEKIKEITDYLYGLEKIVIKGLTNAKLNFIRNGSQNRIPGNVSLSFYRADGEVLLHRMDLKGICISTGAACDSVKNQISHVLRAMMIPEDYARGTVRISLSKNNSEQDAFDIATALISILKKE